MMETVIALVIVLAAGAYTLCRLFMGQPCACECACRDPRRAGREDACRQDACCEKGRPF